MFYSEIRRFVRHLVRSSQNSFENYLLRYSIHNARKIRDEWRLHSSICGNGCANTNEYMFESHVTCGKSQKRCSNQQLETLFKDKRTGKNEKRRMKTIPCGQNK